MSGTHHIPLLFYVLALLALVYFAYNLRLLFTVRIGKEEKYRRIRPFSSLANALTFGVGQRKVLNRRFAYASVMHFFLGWGFIELFFATTVDFFVTRGWFVSYLPTKDTPWFAALNDLGGLAAAGRYPDGARPAQLLEARAATTGRLPGARQSPG